MALIADLCPNCRRVTRCHVVERVTYAGGVLFGIPWVLPASSTTFTCGECGLEFRSESWDHQTAVPPAEAGSLDIEALLSLTNPVLKEKLTFSELKADPQLREAFYLFEQLTPGRLRMEVRDTIRQWSGIDKTQRARFLAKVHDLSEALRFARLMAGRYTTGPVGCLAGALGCLGVWSACIFFFGARLSVWEWIGVSTAGLVTGGLLSQLFWRK